MTGDVASALLDDLADAGEMIALAESCTGGLVAATLTAIPGASRALWGGTVVYTVEAKRLLLGIDEGLLRDHGPVSEPVTRAMATALRRRSGVDVAAAVTGWAGPESDGPDAVGTVHMALADAAGCVARRVHLEGDRGAVREAAATELLVWARRRLHDRRGGHGVD